MNLVELFQHALAGEVDAIGIIWGATGAAWFVGSQVVAWADRRSAVRVQIPPTDMLDDDAPGPLVVENRSGESVFIWRIVLQNLNGEEDVLIGGTPDFQREVPPRQRTSFVIARMERKLRKARRLTVELSTGREVVVRRGALYRATKLHRFERWTPHWRLRRVKSWLDTHLPGAATRAAKREFAYRTKARDIFIRHLDADPPTRPWPQHQAVADIFQMVRAEQHSESTSRVYRDLVDELRHEYDRRLTATA